MLKSPIVIWQNVLLDGKVGIIWLVLHLAADLR